MQVVHGVDVLNHGNDGDDNVPDAHGGVGVHVALEVLSTLFVFPSMIY